MVWIDLSQDKDNDGTYECGSELSAFINGGNFLTGWRHVNLPGKILICAVSDLGTGL